MTFEKCTRAELRMKSNDMEMMVNFPVRDHWTEISLLFILRRLLIGYYYAMSSFIW